MTCNRMGTSGNDVIFVMGMMRDHSRHDDTQQTTHLDSGDDFRESGPQFGIDFGALEGEIDIGQEGILGKVGEARVG